MNEMNDIAPKKVANDHLLLQLNDFSFIIQDVSDINPRWSNKLCIEYQKQFVIPDNGIRQKNKEILSFLLGKHLIKVGETYLDEDNNIIKEVAMVPAISPRVNLKEICKRIEVPAMPPYDIFEIGYFENELSWLVQAYLSENGLDLSYILEYLTSSTTIPTESEIIVIGGCLDELAKIWFKSSKSNSEGELIKKEVFEDLLKDVFPIIKEKLEDVPDVYQTIREGYKISGYKKVKLFLKELGINQGKAEKKARSYRNISAHGQEMNDETRLKMIYLTDVYRTFLNRVILKILGYGVYFDLTTHNILQIDKKLLNKDFKLNYNEIKEFYDKLNKKNGE